MLTTGGIQNKTMIINNKAYERLRKISQDAQILKQDYNNSKQMHEKLKKYINYRNRVGLVEQARNPVFQKQLGETFEDRQWIAHEKFM